MTDDERIALIEKHLDALSEYFDCVQVLAAVVKPSGLTSSYKKGCGLWYARIGLAHEFIDEDRSEDAARRISNHLEPPDSYLVS